MPRLKLVLTEYPKMVERAGDKQHSDKVSEEVAGLSEVLEELSQDEGTTTMSAEETEKVADIEFHLAHQVSNLSYHLRSLIDTTLDWIS